MLKASQALSIFLASLVLSGEIYANVHGIGVRKTNSLETLPSKNWACSSGIIIVIVCVKRICLPIL